MGDNLVPIGLSEGTLLPLYLSVPPASWLARCGGQQYGTLHYGLARAFAVNPARQEARPCGLWGIDGSARPSKWAVMPRMQRCAFLDQQAVVVPER
jgi:hypothetical protein